VTRGDLLHWLRVTHAPYAVAALIMVALVRRTRTVLESIAAALRARQPPGEP
jgi:hypothetical protein